MQRPDALCPGHDPAARLQHGAEQGEVEDMVVKATVFGIATGTGPEFLRRAGQRVAAQVVECENFVEMGEVVLTGSARKIGLQVREGGHGTPVIESVRGVGEQQDEVAARPDNAAPFVQGGEWIGDVLQAVRGEDEAVGGVRDAVQVGGLAQELAARQPGTVEVEFTAIAQIGLPRSPAGEVDVVDTGGTGIDRQDLPGQENATRATELETGVVLHRFEDGGGEDGAGGPEPVADCRDNRACIGRKELAAECAKTVGGVHAGFVAAPGLSGEVFVRDPRRLGGLTPAGRPAV